MHRRKFINAAGSAAIFGFGATDSFAQAKKYPDRPIQIYIGFPGGGALDIATRVITNGMVDEGISPIAIINKPGASATIAAGQVARAPADGYTALLGASANLGIAPFLYPKLPYNAETSLVPVAQFGVSQNVIYSSASSGIVDLKQLLAKITASPGKVNYATPGAGTTPHLCFEMLKARKKLFAVHVPFRGSPAAITSVMAGELDVGIDAIGPTLSYINAGKIVALAQTGEKRSASLPNVPTLAELGISGIPAGTWLGFLLPTGTPAEIARQWSDAVQRVLGKPTVEAQLRMVGIDGAYLDGHGLGSVIARERGLWEAAVKYSGATGA